VQAHDLLELAMEARGVEHTKETRIRIFAINSNTNADLLASEHSAPQLYSARSSTARTTTLHRHTLTASDVRRAWDARTCSHSIHE